MALVLEMNTKSALIGIFDQIMSEDETIREKGLEYVCGPLISLKQKLFSHHPKNEEFLAEQIKKVEFVFLSYFFAFKVIIVKLFGVSLCMMALFISSPYLECRQ